MSAFNQQIEAELQQLGTSLCVNPETRDIIDEIESRLSELKNRMANRSSLDVDSDPEKNPIANIKVFAKEKNGIYSAFQKEYGKFLRKLRNVISEKNDNDIQELSRLTWEQAEAFQSQMYRDCSKPTTRFMKKEFPYFYEYVDAIVEVKLNNNSTKLSFFEKKRFIRGERHKVEDSLLCQIRSLCDVSSLLSCIEDFHDLTDSYYLKLSEKESETN